MQLQQSPPQSMQLKPTALQLHPHHAQHRVRVLHRAHLRVLHVVEAAALHRQPLQMAVRLLDRHLPVRLLLQPLLSLSLLFQLRLVTRIFVEDQVPISVLFLTPEHLPPQISALVAHLVAIIRRAEDGDELAVVLDLETFVFHLVRADDHAKVVGLEEVVGHIGSETYSHSALGGRAAAWPLRVAPQHLCDIPAFRGLSNSVFSL